MLAELKPTSRENWRYIVATGLYLQSLGETAAILTKDNEIIVSKLIRVVWN